MVAHSWSLVKNARVRVMIPCISKLTMATRCTQKISEDLSASLSHSLQECRETIIIWRLTKQEVLLFYPAVPHTLSLYMIVNWLITLSLIISFLTPNGRRQSIHYLRRPLEYRLHVNRLPDLSAVKKRFTVRFQSDWAKNRSKGGKVWDKNWF